MKKLFIVLFLVSVFTVPTIASGKKAVDIDFFAKIKMIFGLQEKDGNIFFGIRQADIDENNYKSDLYQLKNGEVKRLTSSENVTSFYLLEDAIIFPDIRKPADRERKKQGEPLTVFQQLTPGLQEATEWLRLPYNIHALILLDRNRFFFTAGYDKAWETVLQECNGSVGEALKRQEETKSYRIFDELPFWSDGRGDVNGIRTHLYFYDHGTIIKISPVNETVQTPVLSEDKKTLVYITREYETKAPQSNKLVTLTIPSLEKKEWPLFEKSYCTGAWFAGNNQFVVAINKGLANGRNENSGLYRLDIINGELKEIYNGEIYGVGNSVGTDVRAAGLSPVVTNKEGVVYVSTVIDRAPLVQASWKDGSLRILNDQAISVMEYTPYKDGFLLNAMVDQLANELYFMDKKGQLTALTSLNKELFEQHHIVTPQEVTFINEDGILLSGYVLPPVNHEAGKKYPAILDIHGGPKTVYGTVFFHEMQYWANQGYAVLFTNPTGSDGRGGAFADLRGRYGSIDYRDIMRFVDAALEQADFIDEACIGVTGGSYGGFMTNWIIGHTNRFKAAASQRSIASWLSFSNTSDIGYTFIHSQIGADAWTNNDLLWEQSPLKYADKVHTPTLFIHSEEDYRCWIVEGVQMYYALQYFDVPTRLVWFKGESHGLSRGGAPKNRMKRLSEITGWFDRYLK